MKVKAIKDFTVHFVGGGTHNIKIGDVFNLKTTYFDLENNARMVVIHNKQTAPFAVYADNVKTNITGFEE